MPNRATCHSQLVLTLVGFFVIQCSLLGQFRTPQDTLGGRQNDSIITASIDSIETDLGPDTTIYDILFLDDPFTKTPFVNSTLGETALYDQNEQWGDLRLYFGNIGGSSLPIQLQSPENTLISLGYQKVYDSYFIDREEYHLMSINRPFSKVYFSPFRGEDNFIAKGKLSQNIGKLSNFTIDFQRFLQNDYYLNQSTRASSVATSYQIQGKKKRYLAILSYFGKFSDESHNGGLIDPNSTFFNTDGTGKKNAFEKLTDPVYLDDAVTSSGHASTRFQDYSFYIDQHWNTKKDTNGIHIHHMAGYSSGFYKFGDKGTSTSNDSLVYKSLLTDGSGLRNLQKFNQFITRLSVNTRLFNLLEFSGYATYQRYNVIYNNTAGDKQLNQFMFGGKGGFNWNDKLSLIGNIETSTVDAKLYNRINIDANFEALEWLTMNGSIYRNSSPADINMTTLYISDILVYNNTFDPINESGIMAKLSIKPSQTTFTGKLVNLNNAVYSSTDGLPAQFGTSINRAEISLQQNITLGKIHLDNTIHYQSFNENIWHLPTFYSQHDLYIQDEAFEGNLNYRFGFYFRQIMNDNRLAYQPINQAFYPIEGSGSQYPRFDTYVVFRIGQFDAFFKYENMYPLIENALDMQIYGFPHYDNRFRMGVKWLLKD